MRPKQLAGAIDFALAHRFPLLIEGAPGVGKSAIIEQCCAKAGADLVITHPVVSDPTDYKGLPFPAKQTLEDGREIDSAKFLPFGDLLKCISATRPTVFFIDDLGQAPALVQASIMQLLLARRINGHEVSDQVVFMAATNGRGDKAAVQGILEPVKSRFASIIRLEPSVEDWTDWALENGMPALLIAFIQWRQSEGGNMLHDFRPSADMENSPCPRTVAHVGELINAGCPEDILYEMVKGAAGEKFTAEFIGFMRVFDQLPAIDEIIADPVKARLPEESSQTYAVVSALGHATTPKNIANIYSYVSRLPVEFRMLYMKLARQKDAAVTGTRTFVDFSLEFGNLVLNAENQ
ncbi:MAG: ATP-binding protein [Candidatus Cloacimonetes bacterium]|nr:ATP-binding protein [Candidatus Cloacimonadota bacterium]